MRNSILKSSVSSTLIQQQSRQDFKLKPNQSNPSPDCISTNFGAQTGETANFILMNISKEANGTIDYMVVGTWNNKPV